MQTEEAGSKISTDNVMDILDDAIAVLEADNFENKAAKQDAVEAKISELKAEFERQTALLDSDVLEDSLTLTSSWEGNWPDDSEANHTPIVIGSVFGFVALVVAGLCIYHYCFEKKEEEDRYKKPVIVDPEEGFYR